MPQQMGPNGPTRRPPDVPRPTEHTALPRKEFPPLSPRTQIPEGPEIIVRTPQGEQVPLPVVPNIPVSARERLLAGERVNRSSVLDPVNVFAYGTAAAVVYLLAKRAQASGAEPQTPVAGANVAVDPRLQPQTFAPDTSDNPSDVGRGNRALQAAKNLGNLLEQLFFGKVESAAAERALGVRGLLAKVGGLGLKEALSATAAGQGEEAEIARMNEAIRNERRRVADFLFALLRLTPALAGGPGAVVAPPQEQADP